MSYFKTEKHFGNFVRRLLKERGFDLPYMSNEFKMICLAYHFNELAIIDNIIKTKVIEGFAWKIKHSSDLELTKKMINSIFDFYYEFDDLIKGKRTLEECPLIYENENKTELPVINQRSLKKGAEKFLNEISNKSGVYFLYNNEKKLIYIGRSVDLCNRIPSSCSERNASFFKYLITNNAADAFILEPYFISLLKPPLNKEMTTCDFPTIKIEIEEPKTKLIEIFKKSEINEDFKILDKEGNIKETTTNPFI